ncbi:MAG: NAD-dependent epimerase/dehydratase family protein [Gammaproteobacteria bacterium]|jgi:nucleoside-diphosphate-sugar epimerase|nr:NAD-dependent epimerase/dehydratase family protein [Gammaproteobacteria bacterium]HJP05733.1 NAD-dependent epimerase/dehydratase family protein [Gammaproteobacteria bacterium]
MKVLVTGGSGFFGHVLIEKLLARGYEVRNFDLVTSDEHGNRVEQLQGDIRDYDAVKAAVAGMDVVHHNVAQQPISKDPSLMRDVNLGGTKNLLDACAASDIRKVIYTSSTAIFGVPKTVPIRTETEATPAEPYGRTKVACEDLCRKFIDDRSLDITLVRPRTILGHGRLGIFQMLFEWIREGHNIPVLGSGDNRFQFIHADDLAGACILAADRTGPAVYNVGTDRFGTMRETLEALCRHAGTHSKVRSVPMAPGVFFSKLMSMAGMSPLGAYHNLAYGKTNYFDISTVVQDLGWNPRYSNEEMLIESYDWYLDNRDDVLTGKWSAPHRSAVKQGILGLAVRLL